nr:MAG TPA: hypothetical protein [Caudoviricetes sp.]
MLCVIVVSRPVCYPFVLLICSYYSKCTTKNNRNCVMCNSCFSSCLLSFRLTYLLLL